jgi:hypothetical protein
MTTPELYDALRQAAELVESARKYFPKSIHNADRFKLELTAAAIGTALRQEAGK